MDSFYVPPSQIRDKTVEITGEEAHHLIHVLRYQVDDQIRIVDGCGHQYDVSLTAIHQSTVEGKITSETESNEPIIRVILVQALTKGKKFEDIIRHGTEIGVCEFMPVMTERSLVFYKKPKWQKIVERWRRIAISAMKQCGRSILPRIHDPQSLIDIFESQIKVDLKLIASVFKARQPLYSMITEKKMVSSVMICIGPEGGFSEKEVIQAEENGFIPVSLGSRRLRTETAGLVTAGLFCIVYDSN